MDRLLKILSEMALPFAYDHFAEGESPNPPFICYLLPGSDNFSADGRVYYKINEVHIELYQWWQSCLNRCHFRLLSCQQQNNHKRWLTFTYNFWFYCRSWFRQCPQQPAALYHMLHVEKDCLIYIRSYQIVAAFLISNFRNGGTYQ